MPNTIQHKRSTTPGTIPSAGQVAIGELVVNAADSKVYLKNTVGAIVCVGGKFDTPVRQTAVSGSIDAAGIPNALAIGTGLAVTLTATVTPFELTFAAGFNNGAIDYPARFTANQSFSGLTPSTSCYLYIDLNLVTGALTTGFSILVPVYRMVAPTAPVVGQHWFDLNLFVMKVWSGTAWTIVQRVFVGEAITGASSVSAVTTYTYRGAFTTGWFAVSANTNYNRNHYFGMTFSDAMMDVVVCSSLSNTGAFSTSIAQPTVPGTTTGYSYNAGGIDSRLGLGIKTGTTGTHYNGTAWTATGVFYNIQFRRGW